MKMERQENSGVERQAPHHDASEEAEREEKSMHEDMDSACDACSCEPEPRWQAISDEEDDD